MTLLNLKIVSKLTKTINYPHTSCVVYANGHPSFTKNFTFLWNAIILTIIY